MQVWASMFCSKSQACVRTWVLRENTDFAVIPFFWSGNSPPCISFFLSNIFYFLLYDLVYIEQQFNYWKMAPSLQFQTIKVRGKPSSRNENQCPWGKPYKQVLWSSLMLILVSPFPFSYLLLTIFFMIFYFFWLFISFPACLLFLALLLCSFFLAPWSESTPPFIEHCQRRCLCVTTHQCLASEPIKYSEKIYKLYPFLWNFRMLTFLSIP